MALYEYLCENEDCTVEKFDKFVPMHMRDSVTCPECRRKARRLFSSFHSVVPGAAGSGKDFGSR